MTDDRFTRAVGLAAALLMLLGMLLVVAKFAGTIGWSWWFVLAPFWAPYALLALLYVLGWCMERVGS